MTFRGSLQDIRLFVASYEEKSFTAAAVRGNTTQSGVSHHIQQLETLMGVKFFMRERTGVSATPAADAFYRQCIKLLRDIDGAAVEMSRFKRGGTQRRLSIGLSSALTPRIAGPALLRFRELHPNAKVRIVEGAGELLAQLVNTGELDFAVGTARGGKGIRARKLLDVPEVLICSATEKRHGSVAQDHPLRHPIDLVLATSSRSHRAAVFACLEAHEISVRSEVEVDSALAILDLVNRNGWTTVGPCLTMDPVVDLLRYSIHPLIKPGLNFSVFHIESAWRMQAPEAQIFVELLVEEMQCLIQSWNDIFSSAILPGGRVIRSVDMIP